MTSFDDLFFRDASGKRISVSECVALYPRADACDYGGDPSHLVLPDGVTVIPIAGLRLTTLQGSTVDLRDWSAE